MYAHIIGYKSDILGSNEIEKYYNSDLTGKSSAPLVGNALSFVRDIKYIFESGIITEDDLCNFSSGNGLKLTPQKIIFKLSKCIKKSNLKIL